MSATQYNFFVLLLSMAVFTFIFGLIGHYISINWLHFVGIGIGTIFSQYYLHKNPYKDSKD